MLPVRPSRRFALLGLLAISAVSPLRAEAPPPKGAPLSDEEVRAWLERDELPAWNRLAASRTEAERLVARGKDMQNARAGAEFKGVGDSPEARKAKGDALMKAGQDKLAAIAKARADLAAVAAGRMNSGVIASPCPVLALPDAFAAGAGELVAFARREGYGPVSCAGVLIAAKGRPISPDAMLGSLFAEKVGAALASAGPAPAEAALAGVATGEVHPLDPALGALVSLRLADAKTGVLRRVVTVVVPSGATVARGADGVAYRVVFRDTRNFLGRLGVAEKWDFRVEGDGPAGPLLKAALVSRGAPVVLDADTLGRLGSKVKTEEKGVWRVETEPEAPGVWRVSSRTVAPGAKPVPVGLIALEREEKR